MTTTNVTPALFVQYELWPISGFGDAAGQITIDNRTGDGTYSINTDASNNRLYSPILVNNTTNPVFIVGDVAGGGTQYTRAEQATFMGEIVGDVEGWEWYGEKHTNVGGTQWGSGNTRSSLEAFINSQSAANGFVKIVIHYLEDETNISFCESGIYYRYDDDEDKIYVVFTGTGYEYELASSITNQADIETFFESIYNIGTWNYAYNVTTGNICVTYAGTGTGEWNFSTELDEIINLEDSATAFIISRWPVDMSRWV